MKQSIFFIALPLFFLCSCSPRIITDIKKNLDPIEPTQEVKVYEFLRNVPKGAELLGSIVAGDSGFTTNCGYTTMLNIIQQEARKAGGNAIYITNHLEPSVMSTCHQLAANIYFVSPTNIANNESISIQITDSLSNNKSLVTKDTIEIQKTGLSYKYIYKGEVLQWSQLNNLMRDNAESYTLYRSAKSTSDFLSVLGYVGGLFVGSGIGTSIRNPEVGLKLIGIGSGVLLVSLPIISSADKKLKKAVNIYNSDMKSNASVPQYKMQLASTKNGLGLVIMF